MYQQIFELHAEILKALAHPRRLEILHLLRDKMINVSDMQTMLGLPQANLSQHLKVLREAGVVAASKEGKQVKYKLAHKNFVKASDLVREVLVERNKNNRMIVNELTMKMKDLLPIVKDIVCGMRVSPKTAAYVETYNNQEYYFCASGCLNQFKKNPQKFIKN